MMSVRFIVSALCLLLVGCGQPPLGERDTFALSAGDPEALSDAAWREPLGQDAERVPDVARAHLPYEPEQPNLPEASGIQVTSAAKAPPELRQIAWTYDDPSIGRFVVLQELIEGGSRAQEILEQPAQRPSGCVTISPYDEEHFGEGAYKVECSGGGTSLVQIRDGTTAVAVQAAHSTSVTWLQPVEVTDRGVFARLVDPRLQITVKGPSSDFSLDEAIAVANRL